jgi:D-psicose/D-tagatose/L-ribulose 3-epimerase
MNLGMNLFLWTDNVQETHLPIIEKLAKLGYQSVEVPVFAGEPAHFKKIGKQIAGMGLKTTSVLAMFAENNPASPDAKVRQAAADSLKAAIDRSEALGSRILCGPLHSGLGLFTGQGPTKLERKNSAAVLKSVGNHAKKAKVTLAVEYLNRFEAYLLTTMADTVKYIDDIDHPNVGLMFDTFHAHIEEKDSVAALQLAGDRLVHVHLSENDRGTPGTGQIAWTPVMRELRRRNYQGQCTIEAFGRALPNLAAATKVWRDFFPSQDDVAERGQQFLRAAWATAG